MARQSDARAGGSGSATSGWPSGAKFLLYCAGISLLALVGFVILKDKPFELKATREGVALSSPLNPGAAAPAEVTAKEGEVLKKRAEELPVDQPISEGAPYNGRWQGYGSTYVIEQRGSMVSLVEETNGVITTAAIGAVTGDLAVLQAQNLLGVQFQLTAQRHGSELVLMAMGRVLTLQPE